MTVLVTKPAVNIREELADLKDQTTYDTVKSAGALMDAELTNEAAVKSIDQALTTTSNVAFNQVTADLVGNASTATTLETARDIALSGDVTGSASFDGSGNITIMATVVDDSHSHVISNVDGLQTALDAKQPLDADLTAIAALSSADGNIIVGSASGWVAESGATARASLGLTIGTDVQPYDANTAKYNDATANFTGTLQNNGSNVVTQADVDDVPVDGVTTAPVSSNWAYDHQNATAAHGVSGAVVGTSDTQTLTNKTLNGLAQGSTISDGVGTVGIGYRNIPAVTVSGAVTASAAHLGKCLVNSATGTLTVPSTLAVGTVISVWVNSSSALTIAKSGGTMYVNGASVASCSVSGYGVATIYFPLANIMVVTGNVS